MKRKSASNNDAEAESAKPRKPSKACIQNPLPGLTANPRRVPQKTKLREEDEERDELDSEQEAPLTAKKPAKYRAKAEVRRVLQVCTRSVS